MTALIRLMGLIDGMPTAYDGRYLKRYEPGTPGVDPEGRPMQSTVEVCEDPADALQFPNVTEAWECWRQVHPHDPVRPHDGQPNRPLTAFSIEVVPLADAGTLWPA